MCPSLENPDLWLQETSDSQGPAHYRPAECGRKLSRPDQIIQTEWSVLPEVFQLICTRWLTTSSRHVCNKVQQVTLVCVTSFRLTSLGSGCFLSALGGSGPYVFPPVTMVVKLRDHPCRRLLQGGPTRPGSGTW